MTFLRPRYALSTTIAAALFLTACGGGGSSSDSKASYNGKTSPAAFSNLEQHQQTAVLNDSYNAVEEALSAQSMTDELPFGVEAKESVQLSSKGQHTIISKALTAAKNANATGPVNLPIGINQSNTEDCDGGGNSKFSFSGDENKGAISIQYNNCKESYWGGDYTITNGEVKVSFKSNSIEATFKNYSIKDYSDGVTDNYTVNGYYKITGVNWGEFDQESATNYSAEWNLNGTENGQKFSSNGTLTCKNSKCTVGSIVKTPDGKTYKFEDFDVSSIYHAEYQVKGTLYHPDYGYYTIEINSEYGCSGDDKSPFVGTAELTSKDGTITYKSNSCSVDPTISLK